MREDLPCLGAENTHDYTKYTRLFVNFPSVIKALSAILLCCLFLVSTGQVSPLKKEPRSVVGSQKSNAQALHKLSANEGAEDLQELDHEGALAELVASLSDEWAVKAKHDKQPAHSDWCIGEATPLYIRVCSIQI